MTSLLLTQPDWSAPIEEVLQWGASRVRSRNGAAERVELVAPWPRRTLRLAGWADVVTDRALLDLGPSQHLVRWLPGRSRVVDAVSTTQYTIAGDPTARGYRVGDSVLFETATGESEIETISVVTTDVFVGAEPSITVGAGATMTPLYACEIVDDSVQVARLSPSTATIDIGMRVLDTQHDGADDAPAESWTVDLDGTEVLTRLATTSEAHAVRSERIAGISGAVSRIVPGTGQTIITQQHIIMSALEALDLRRWLYRRRGPLEPCLVPLGLSLGPCVVETHEALAVLEIDDPGADDLAASRSSVIVWASDGTISVHEIGDMLRPGEASVPEGRAWLVGLDPALTAPSVRAAQWLVLCRLSGEVTLRWHSPEVVEATLVWVSTP